MPRFVAVLALSALVSPPALAQSQDTTPVPRELALALISANSRGVAELTAGKIPSGFAQGIVPPGTRVLGGITYPEDPRGVRTSVVIVATGDRAEDAITRAKTTLEGAGWKEAVIPQRPMGGFVSTMSERGPSVLLCRDDASLWINTEERSQGGSLLRLSLTPRRGNMCDEDRRRNREGDQVTMLGSGGAMSSMPALRPPTGVFSRGGGAGGGDGYREASTILETKTSAADLVAHYSAQLLSQGWKLGKRFVDDDLVIQTARRREGGFELTGLLGAVPTAGDRRSVWFRMTTPPRER